MSTKIVKSLSEWREILTPDVFRITREKGTEYPGTGEFLHHNQDGSYQCICCGDVLFNSNSKFDSGCGWPSFDDSIEGKVEYVKDTSMGMVRIEIVCAHCDSHLGHVFDDGPTETGKRYCVNSLSLSFNDEK